jgi:hypothetical protein
MAAIPGNFRVGGDSPGTEDRLVPKFSIVASAVQHELRVCSADDFQIADNLPSTEGNECFQHRQDYLLCRHFEGLRPSGMFKEALFRTPPCPRKGTASLLNFVLRQNL